jgi:hypothetical protein
VIQHETEYYHCWIDRNIDWREKEEKKKKKKRKKEETETTDY